MPVVQIYGNDGIDKDTKAKMVKEVTKIVADSYGLPEQAITILIQPLPADDVGVAGELLSNRTK